MVKNIFIYNPYSNQTVTEYYLKIIEESCNDLGLKVEYGKKLKRPQRGKESVAFVISPEDVVRAKMSGFSRVIVWAQGIVPEESYMRHKSKIRKLLLSLMEIIGLKSADAIFMVSEQMRYHYQKKYGFEAKRYFIMPCFDQEISREAFFIDGKYNKNVFIYAGGLQIWQCFEDSIVLFKQIENKIPDAFLKIFTKDSEQAEAIIRKHGIRNYSVQYVSHEQIAHEHEQAKFGFAIREDNIVNNVATPTKLSTYIANGVMPIYTRYVEAFYEKAKQSSYCFDISENMDEALKSIIEMCKKEVYPEKIYEDYTRVFGDYYSRKEYKRKIENFLMELFELDRRKSG